MSERTNRLLTATRSVIRKIENGDMKWRQADRADQDMRRIVADVLGQILIEMNRMEK